MPRPTTAAIVANPPRTSATTRSHHGRLAGQPVEREVGKVQLPEVQGQIEHRLRVNYRVDPEAIARHLPDPTRPDSPQARAAMARAPQRERRAPDRCRVGHGRGSADGGLHPAPRHQLVGQRRAGWLRAGSPSPASTPRRSAPVGPVGNKLRRSRRVGSERVKAPLARRTDSDIWRI
jgi:hypothetical protein